MTVVRKTYILPFLTGVCFLGSRRLFCALSDFARICKEKYLTNANLSPIIIFGKGKPLYMR